MKHKVPGFYQSSIDVFIVLLSYVPSYLFALTFQGPYFLTSIPEFVANICFDS